MPGAELTEVVDETTWKGKVTVKLGPVKLNYRGKVVMQERDDDVHRVMLKATGQETGGKGTATATVTSTLETAGQGTRVLIVSDLTLSGAAAQYGRGMVGDVSKRLTDQFAECLQGQLSPAPAAAPADEETAAARPTEQAGAAPDTGTSTVSGPGAADRGAAPAPRPSPPQQKPIAGFRLMLWTLWRAVVRFVKRLLGRNERR